MSDGTQRFTASQVARATGLSCQAIAQGLVRSVDPAVIDQAAWSLAELPNEWQGLVAQRGAKRGFETAESFLMSLPIVPWECPVAWDSIPEKERLKAARLQKAMSRALAMRDSGPVATGSLESIGTEDFKTEFGYPISGRQWRRLVARTVQRDGGLQNWKRLDIYLDERAFTRRERPAHLSAGAGQHAELDELLSRWPKSGEPAPEVQALIWDGVFEHYERLTEGIGDSGGAERQRRRIKASLIGYLAGKLAAIGATTSEMAVERQFRRRLELWRQSGRNPEALLDQRPERSGRPGRKLCPTCKAMVAGAAVDLDGDLSQAWRRLQLAKMFCSDCSTIGSFDVRRRKSEVPKSVRADVIPGVLDALPHRRGPKHARLVSPYVRRDPDDIGPGEWAECDDMTPNHVAHAVIEVLTWDLDMAGRPFIGRMELLLQIDRRTTNPWAYVIILGDPATDSAPQRKATYNSIHCRLLFLRGHDSLGLPHHGGGFQLENAIWKSVLIAGKNESNLPTASEWEINEWDKFELGLRDPRIGLRLKHAKPGVPRTKLIERVFLTLQNRMRCLPGFVGFNERQDKRERMDEFIARVKAGKEHPGNEVPSIAEFRSLLDTELLSYGDEPQNGIWLPGVSPREAFQNGIGGYPGISTRPLRQLGANARYLLSTHQRALRVTGQGIKFKIGAKEFVFWGPELEQFQNTKILARFNFEEPELITCQPPDAEPFTMRARILPSTTASPEQLRDTERARASWMRRGKVIYDSLPHPLRTTITRDSEQSQETLELGQFHNSEMEKFRAQKAAARRTQRKARELAAELGASREVLERHPDRILLADEMLRESQELRKEGVND